MSSENRVERYTKLAVKYVFIAFGIWFWFWVAGDDLDGASKVVIILLLMMSADLGYKIDRLQNKIAQLEEPLLNGGYSSVKPTNLRFEGEAVRGMPDGWSDGHGIVSGISTLYRFDVESREEGSGEQCVRMHRVNASNYEFGSLMQRWPAHTLAGRGIRIEADIRTEDVDNGAGLWLRIDGEESSELFFDNMADRPIQGTTSWKTYSQETEVPNEAKWVNYGFLLSGNGALWAANVRVTVSDEKGQYKPV
ncbi:MAG TPA: hypothetical protein EYQ14_03290 [Gammaproteobacteria bacterium]|nr:hypothetical protein [Gammaproteobacteria bacterium]